MKWLLVSTAAVGLALATPAMAAAASGQQVAQMDHKRDRDHKTSPRHQQQPKQTRPGVRAPQHRQPARQTRPATHMQQPMHQQMQRHETRTRPMPRQQQRFDWGHYKQGHPPANWSKHKTFNMGAWQHNRRATHRYHLRAYRRPSGWFARTWVFGMVLPTLFWTRDYWITNYWEYGLADPPYGYVWVRNGDDALLVNVSSGYILQVVYGLFD